MSPCRRRVDYSSLTATERVALVLRAEARGDREDARRLMRDAPVADYQITDPKVTDRLEDAHRLLSWALVVERPALADAAVVGMMLKTLPQWVGWAGDAASWQLFRVLSNNGDRLSHEELDGLLSASHEAVRERFDALLSVLEERERCALRVAVGVWTAVDEVSRQLFGVDGETLAAALLPVQLRTEVALDAEPDRQVVAEMVELLLDKLASEAEP